MSIKGLRLPVNGNLMRPKRVIQRFQLVRHIATFTKKLEIHWHWNVGLLYTFYHLGLFQSVWQQYNGCISLHFVYKQTLHSRMKYQCLSRIKHCLNASHIAGSVKFTAWPLIISGVAVIWFCAIHTLADTSLWMKNICWFTSQRDSGYSHILGL